MNFRIALSGLLALCAQATLTASTTYSLGAASNISLADESYAAGVWTENYNGPAHEQIVCVVALAATADVCGDGSGGSGPGSAANIPITAPTGTPGGGVANYLMADGDPDYGAPISTLLSGLTIGDSYTISFYQAASEENPVGTPTAYDDSWQVYLLPTSFSAGTYICPQEYCSSHSTVTAAPNAAVYTSPAMDDTAGGSTTWEQESFQFTATATSQVLEFVTNVATSTGATITSGASFQPPMLDLADVTSTQNSSTPEPSTWALTLLGAGLIFVGGKLRRRGSARG
jgi:prepilin-type processing-associated H-X9-DG protein